MEEKKFLQAYQAIKFHENSSNPFLLASTKRKILALNFYASLQLKESNQVTEYLLEKDLEEYSEIVDNKEPGKVNNYADYVLPLLSNYQNDDRKNWKSSLNEYNIEEFLKPLACSNGINCKNAELISEDIDELRNAIASYQLEEEKEKKKRFLGAAVHGEKENSISSHSFDMPAKKVVAVERNIRLDKQGTEAYNKQFDEESQSDEEKLKKNTFFRTARAELQIQNAKKFGRGCYSSANEKSLNYGTVKKSLGTRKGGVFGKFQPPLAINKEKEQPPKENIEDVVDERLKNIDPAMIELIKNEIMECGTKITWNDIAGLQLAKNTIQEIVVWPMLRPDIFTGLRRPPKGILLFGPPGTGKTLIGKCIASQSNSTFFSISASSLTSKWIGDGEKMVRTLFAVAKVYQPSVVFIDEIDSLLSQRSDSEHESSRRIKTEFLVQLDGAGTGEEDRILIIGATNRPQELDEAARRRLVKRLYIPLPETEARKQIIQNLISNECHCLTESDIEHIATLTDGYSGADVKNLCQEASLGPIRSIPASLIQSIDPNNVRPLNMKDFESALCRIKSSVSESDLSIYVEWNKQYGCSSV